MRVLYISTILIALLFSQNLQGQHLQLIESRGELGVYTGYSSYNGDVSTDKQFIKPAKGIYYKRLLNDYIGIKINYEDLQLYGNDLLSSNNYENTRGFQFQNDLKELSLSFEFNFLKLINGNEFYRLTPYLGIGYGQMIDPPKTMLLPRYTADLNFVNINTAYFVPSNPSILIRENIPAIRTYPIYLGFKYNLFGQLNFFTEISYRFTNSDLIDALQDDELLSRTDVNLKPIYFQASRTGKDQFMTGKLGISYTFRKIYGPEKLKYQRKAALNLSENGEGKPRKFRFNPFKRN